MKVKPFLVRYILSLALCIIFNTQHAIADSGLKVAATTTDLGDIAKIVGGEQVEVRVFARGSEDPHFVQPKPSHVVFLNQADAVMLVGLELEIGWLPVLLDGARNNRIAIGKTGYIDCSEFVSPLELNANTLNSNTMDRSMGDVHPLGNPHYLLDPLNGIRVARGVSEKFAELMPERRDEFHRRYASFAGEIISRLYGAVIANKYTVGDLLSMDDTDVLQAKLYSPENRTLISGWYGALAPFAGIRVIADHKMWPYFARRYNLSVVDHLEPLPGIPPTTSHLEKLVAKVKEENIKVLMINPYYDTRHAEFVARTSDIKLAAMAHQVSSREGTDGYLKLNEFNVRSLETILVDK